MLKWDLNPRLEFSFRLKIEADNDGYDEAYLNLNFNILHYIIFYFIIL